MALRFVFSLFVLSYVISVVSVVASDVVVLTESNFASSVATDSWLIEFYAPWCGHCKQLAPIYEQAATRLRGKIRLGQVDCTVESRLSSEFKVKGYPTLKFFRSGDHRPYAGARTLDAIVQFGEMMAGPPVIQLESLAHLQKIQGDSAFPVAFLFFDSPSAQDNAADIFRSVALRRQGFSVRFLSVPSSKKEIRNEFDADQNGYEGQSAVVAVSEGEEREYFLMGDKPWTEGDLLEYVDRHRLPLISTLEGQNFDDITSTKKLLGFIVIDPQSDDSADLIKQLFPIAAKYRDSVLFASVDGVKYGKYVSQFRVSEDPSTYPTFALLDFPDYFYSFPNPAHAIRSDAQVIDEFIADAIGGRISSTNVLSWYNPSRYTKMIEKQLDGVNEIFLIGGLVLMFVLLAIFLFYICLSGTESEEEEKPEGPAQRREGDQQNKKAEKTIKATQKKLFVNEAETSELRQRKTEQSN